MVTCAVHQITGFRSCHDSCTMQHWSSHAHSEMPGTAITCFIARLWLRRQQIVLSDPRPVRLTRSLGILSWFATQSLLWKFTGGKSIHASRWRVQSLLDLKNKCTVSSRILRVYYGVASWRNPELHLVSLTKTVKSASGVILCPCYLARPGIFKIPAFR